MMQLKLLGVLQDYYSPYVSLYRDDNSQNLYLAVEQDSDKPKEFCTLLLHVSKRLVEYYLQNKMGLREIYKNVKSKYLWFHKKDQIGTLVDVGNEDVSKYIDIDDDMFDPDFCNHEASITYYLNK